MSSFTDRIKKVNEERKAASYKQPSYEEDEEESDSFIDRIKKVNDGTIKGPTTMSATEVNNWLTGVNNTSKSAYSYLSRDGYKTPDTKLQKDIDDYLSKADYVGQYLRANKSSLSNYDEMMQYHFDTVSYLRQLKDGLKSSDSHYAKFETEDEYNAALKQWQEYYDKWGHNTEAADFNDVAANRDYKNPTEEDLTKKWAASNSDSWKWEAYTGNGYDAFGNKLIAVGDEWHSPLEYESKYQVTDPLGIFLNASQEQIDGAGDTELGPQGEYWDIIRNGIHNSWTQLDKKEIDMYYYLLGTQGIDKAMEYLDDTTEVLNSRAGAIRAKNIQDANGFTEFFLSGLLAVEAGAEQWATGVGQAITGKVLPTSATQYASGEISNDLSVLGKYAYSAANTVGNMLPSILISKGIGAAGFGTKVAQGVGSAALGLSAGGNAYGEAVKAGYSEGQAKAYGVLVGASEAALQNLIGGIGSLGGVTDDVLLAKANMIDNSLLRVSAKLGTKIGFEILEEEAQLFLEPLFKSIIMGEDYDAPTIDAMFETAIVTFLSTGALEGGSTIASDIAENRQLVNTGKTIQGVDGGLDALKALANEMAGVSPKSIQKSLNKQVNKVSKEAGSDTTARRVGRLYDTVQTATAEQNQADIVKSLTRKGFSKIMANSIAQAMVAQANGQDLSFTQRNLLGFYQNNDRVQNAQENIVSNEKSTMGQRNQNISDFNNQISSGVFLKAVEQAMAAQSIEEEFTPTGDYKTSVDGKAIDTKTGDAIDIKGVASIRDGELLLDIGDGKTVNAKDVSYADSKDALIYEAVANLGDRVNAETANKLISQYKGGDAMVFARGITQAYSYGFWGIDKSELTSETSMAAVLTKGQMDAAYQLGAQYRPVKDRADQGKARASMKPGEKGVYYRDKNGNAIDIRSYMEQSGKTLTPVRKTAIEAMEKLAATMGVRFNVFETWNENGATYYLNENGVKTKGNPNGFYDPKTGEIYIDLNAGNDFSGTMLFTAAHELTHFLRQWSPEHFTKISRIVFKHGGMKGRVSELAAKQQAKAKRAGRDISFDEALEEVVADGMETILKDGKVLEFMAEVKQQDQTAWEKIKEWFKNFAESLKELIAAYSGRTADSTEGQIVAEAKDILSQIEQIYAEGAVAAGENYQQSLTPGKEGTIVNESGEPVAHSTADGTVQLSMRTYEEGGRDAFRTYLQKCVTSKKLTKAEMTEMIDGIEEIYNTCKAFKDKYAPFSTWSDAAVVRDTYGKPVFSVVTPNGDYKMNLDFSLVCKKRRTLDAVFNEMSKRGIIDDFELGQKSVVKINEIIRKHGFETACALCFVDAKRFRQASMADSFTSLYNELVQSLVPESQQSSIDRFNFAGYDTIQKVENGIDTWDNSKLDFSHIDHVLKTYGDGTVEYKAAKYIKTHPEGRKLLLRGDFMSSKGFDAVKSQNPDVLKLYNSKKGTGGLKAAFGDVQYMNEVIQKARWWTPAKAYAVGGVRVQSFSDYVPRMVFDYVQMIYDLAATKLPAHAYTKEALFVKQFGLTGIKINMSLIPAIADGGIAPGLDANGNYVWAGESFDFETAKQIQSAEGYTENCGTICVGVSDLHIRKLLNDPNIRQVIPYHKSGLNPIVAHMNRIAQFKDYTGSQNTLDQNGSKVEKDFDFNQVLHKMGENGDPKAVVDQYLEWCDSKGYTPKFSQFRDNPNYYKLIEDFTLYDTNNQYVPQREVRAVFPTKDSAFGSMKDLINEGLQEDAVIEGKREASLYSIVDEIQQTLPKTEAEIEAQEVEQADRDLDANSKFSFRGTNKDGIEVYETSEDIKNLPYTERQQRFLDIMENEYRGRTAKFIRNGHAYYATFEQSDVNKNIYGDNRSDKKGWKAKINVGAEGNIFELVENARYDGSKPEKGKKIAAHRGVGYWDYFVKNVQIDGTVFDLIANVRKKADGAFVYSIQLNENKKIKASPPRGSLLRASSGVPNASGTTVTQPAPKVNNKNSAPHSDRDSDGNVLSKEQQEFFKDSKARDKKGDLLRLYHGSNYKITKFNPMLSDDKTSLFMTDKFDVAASYTRWNRELNPYEYIDENSTTEELLEAASKYVSGKNNFQLVSETEIKAAEDRVIPELPSVLEKLNNISEKLNNSNLRNTFGARGLSRNMYTAESVLGSNPTQSDYEKLLSQDIGKSPWLSMVADLLESFIAFDSFEFVHADIKEVAQEIGSIRDDAMLLHSKGISDKGRIFRYEDNLGRMDFMSERQLFKEINWMTSGGILPVYANITNPFVVEAKGRRWNNIATPAEMRSFHDYDTTNTRTVAAYAKANGYDGVIFKGLVDMGGNSAQKSQRSTVVIAFDGTQMKSTMNQNPTSDPDIRFQDRDTESVSNRSLLANAFEGVAQNDIERNKIQEYKSKIDLINSEEQKLRELNEQIKELSFAKGPRDTAKIRELQFEAKQTANRIGVYDKQLLRLEASKPLQDVLNREKKMAYQRAEQKGKEALAAYREKAAKTQRELLDRYRDSRKKAVEGREKTAVRHKIQNVVGELNQLLLTNDKKRHVPDSLKKAVADALSLVNMDTVGAEERAARYATLIAKETDPDKIDAYTVTMENILRQGEKMGQRLKELRDAYEEIQNSDDPDIANAYDPVIAGSIAELSQTIGNTSLRDMTIEQLQDVYDMYKMVLTRVRDANKSLIDSSKETIANRASRVVGEVRRVGGEHKVRAAVLDPMRDFSWNNLKPVYAMERIGSATMTEAFNNVRKGEDTWAQNVTDARAYYIEKSKKYGYDSWDFKKRYRFKSVSEQEFDLTLEQILSLYAYSKRDQAGDHLKLGGFVFDSNIETYKEKGSKLLKYKVNTADAHQISPEILAEITGTLTKEQTAFVDEMQDYLSTVMGAKGNEVTMKLYGVKLFKEKFYFPLKSARQFMFEQNEVSGEVKIKNSGFTNKTKPKANNPVILNNFMDVWANHVNDMSMYHAFVLPLEDFNRIFNYNSPKKEGKPPVSVKGTIQSAYSPAAVNYVKQLITDLNGGAMADPRETFAKGMTAKFKKAKVFSSMSVVIQQPAAIGRAYALVDPKYFKPTKDGMNHKQLWDELKHYAPVAVIKEMGYFDTNMGRSTMDFIKAKEYSTFGEQAKAVFADSGYRDEILSKLPALADELTWCAIWNAVKRETVAKHHDLSPRSEEFMKIAGERFTEVITKTQVYDSVLARSANMRSKSGLMSMITAFMAEPTTSVNMLEDAILKGKRGDKGYAARAFASVAVSVILNNALVALVYGARDDDEDETFAEKYLQAFVSGMLDDLNPITYYPFLKDMWSLLQGYDIERSDMSLVSDLANSMKGLVKAYTSEDGDVAEAWWTITGAVANIGGIPMQNIRREVNGAINFFNTLLQDFDGRATTWMSMGDALEISVRDNLPVVGWFQGDTKTDNLYDAIISGDTAYVSRLKSSYKDKDGNFSQTKYDMALRKALRENDPRIKEAAQAQINGDPSERVRIAKQIIADGFVQDDVVAAINAEINSMTSGAASSDTKKAKGNYTATDFATEVANGDWASATAAKTDIIDTAKKNGKSQEEAEKSFVNSATSELKDLFQAGRITESKAVDALVKYCGKNEDDALADVQYWAFKRDYPNTYADDAWFDKYYEEVADSGIEIDVYMDYRNRVKDITGEGKKERRMAVIDSLPITNAQKDALYFAEGWSKSTLYEAPWH